MTDLNELKRTVNVINELNHKRVCDDSPETARERVIDTAARWSLLYGNGLVLESDRPCMPFDEDMTADTDRMTDEPETYTLTLHYAFVRDRVPGEPFSYELYFEVADRSGNIKDTLDRVAVHGDSVALILSESGRAYLTGGYPDGTPCPFCGTGPMYGKVSNGSYFVRCSKCGRFSVTYACRPGLRRMVGLYLWEDVLRCQG